MYKPLFIIALLSVITFNTRAQKFEGGLIAGLLASQIDGDFLGGYNKAGVTFGGWVGYPITEDFSMHGELRYIQKGKAKLPVPEEGIISETTRLSYLQLPIMLQYNLQTKWFLEGGFGFGYLFHYSFLEGGTKLNEENYPIQADEFFYGELCFLLGAGYHISDKLAVNLRFTNDIFPIADLTNAVGTNPWINPGSLFNKTLELTLMYSIDIRN
ncbi:porin family protein [Saccharicrinis sp. FJH2]|uniref:porin family protein n=1 Tax=unclassified Saccharicrinis TaxID=2646859 RepID=UPI0035D515B8